jgi:hypothetical protein
MSRSAAICRATAGASLFLTALQTSKLKASSQRRLLFLLKKIIPFEKESFNNSAYEKKTRVCTLVLGLHVQGRGAWQTAQRVALPSLTNVHCEQAQVAPLDPPDAPPNEAACA